MIIRSLSLCLEAYSNIGNDLKEGRFWGWRGSFFLGVFVPECESSWRPAAVGAGRAARSARRLDACQTAAEGCSINAGNP